MFHFPAKMQKGAKKLLFCIKFFICRKSLTSSHSFQFKLFMFACILYSNISAGKMQYINAKFL